MKTNNAKWMLGLCAVVLSTSTLVRAQDDTMSDSTTSETTTTTTTDDSNMATSGMSGGMDMRMKNAQMLIRTLSEEKTEIAALTAQQARFRAMGGRENLRIARMWGRWIAEHKAGGPMLMRLIKQNGGDPMAARVLKPAPLGSKEKMLAATHKDHEMAVMTSQMRYTMTGSPAIKRAMHKRANLARKHLRQMAPIHDKMMHMDKMAVQG